MYCNRYACFIAHICTNALIYIQLSHTSKNQPTFITMLLPYMCQQQICSSNATYKPYIQISSSAGYKSTISVHIPYMNSTM